MDAVKKKVFYWAPCLNKVGTVISTKNSAIALAKYKNDLYEVYIINACGEWDEYLNEFKKYNIKIINLTFSYYSYFTKNWIYTKSVILYINFFDFIFPIIILFEKI